MLKEWIVTLYDRNELDNFYEDMQTPGGSLYIPDRAVDVSAQRPTSRNTHYMLTYEEAMLVKNDKRVWGVELYDIVVNSFQPFGYKIDEGVFSKNVFTSGPALSQIDVNWGLLRQNRDSPPVNWGFDNFLPQDPNNSNQFQSELLASQNNVIITASGRNVDVLIVDEHLDQGHPEFTVNRDGSGGTRCVAYNWFQNDIGFGTGTYVYGLNQSNHGTHCGGTAAGNNQGWARDANIYSIGAFSNTVNWQVLGYDSTTMWDYIRAWHNTKPINPVTGRKNPTVSNHSYGSITSVGDSQFSNIKAVTYRGVRYAPGRDLTVSELQARGFKTDSQSFSFQFYSTSQRADLEDAMADGIIICTAAGNESWKQVQEGHVDYNNEYEVTYLPIAGSTYSNYYQRGGGGRSGQAYPPVIVVGAVGTWKEEYKAHFSNCGNGVDVFAAGEVIQSSVHLSGYFATIQDPRSSGAHYLAKTNGTSMATPQVCGMLACLAESWPNMTQTQAHQWIIDFSAKNVLSDTGTDNAMDVQSLQGAPNRFARWINQRPVDGGTFPQRNFRPRTVDNDPVYYGKRLWPRPRIRRRG